MSLRRYKESFAYSLNFPFCSEYSSREDMEEALDTLDGTDLDGARECYHLREEYSNE